MYACTRSASSAAKTEQGSKQKAHVTYLNSVCSFICAKVRIFIPRIGAISPHVLSISGIFMLYYVVDCEFVPCIFFLCQGFVVVIKTLFSSVPTGLGSPQLIPGSTFMLVKWGKGTLSCAN